MNATATAAEYDPWCPPDPQPGKPGYEEWLDYEEWSAKQACIFRTRQRRRCYQCDTPAGSVTGEPGAMRRVVREITVLARFDPTAAYKLTCDHVAIDC